jgi:hypothetical protein
MKPTDRRGRPWKNVWEMATCDERAWEAARSVDKFTFSIGAGGEITVSASQSDGASITFVGDADQVDRFFTKISGPDRHLGVTSIKPTNPAAPTHAYRLLHALLPARQRDPIERDLEEQLQRDSVNPLIGSTLAKKYYTWRCVTTVLSCWWNGGLLQLRDLVGLFNPLFDLFRKLGGS